MKSELCVIVYICSLYIFFTDAQSVLIEGSNPRELIGGTNARIICKVTSGIADGENPNLEWFNQAGNKVPNTGRVYVYANDAKESSLMITKVEEDDGGSYNCSGVINGQKEYARIVVTTKMPVVVTENQAPRNQKFSNGTNAQVKCAPQGDVQVSWLDKDGQPIFSTHDRYVINSGHLLIPDILTTDDGTYTCRVVGSDDFLNVQINVIVTVPPKITRPPTGQSISVGDAARFECIATAKPKPTYQWFKDDQSIELAGSRYEIDADNGILIIKKVIKDDHGNYRCKAFSEGKFDEKTAELRVLVPPQIVKLDDATGDEGSGGTIKCIASGDPIPEIKWQKQGKSQDFTDGTQIDETRILVSHQQRSDRMEVEGSLDISNLVSSDAGVYICKATNEAKSVEQTATLTVQYKPNFSKVKKDVLFSWSGKETVITCIASSVPQSNISWEKDNQPITAGNGYSMSSVIIGDDTTGTLSFLVDFSNAASRYGVYTCKASNRIGESKKNFTLEKADAPESPSTNIKDPTPTSLILVVSIPNALPRVTKISVNYANLPNPIERPISQGQKQVEVYVAGLSARTQYNFLVTARSEVGSSPELSLPYTTLAPRRPYPITVISRPIGDYPLRYNLQWNTPSNGGYAISNIYIKYAEVEVFPNKSQSNEFQKKDEISGWYEVKPALAGDVTTYEITGLKPSTYYEVKVTATNIEGSSDEKPMIFLTSLVQGSGYIGFAQALLPSKLVLTMATVLWACLGILL